MAEDGFDVLLVSGGAPIPLDLGPARLHQLPPVRARDATLRELARLDGSPLDEAFRVARARELVSLLQAETPSVVITEQFPFGRTQLRFELVPLLEAARDLRPRPLIVSSVRDVVRRTASPARVTQTIETLADFDLVLIHADPAMANFAASFVGWEQIAARAVYTGYVASPATPPKTDDAGKGEVIVSVGGGAVGGPLLKAAIAARPLSRLANRRWRLLVGGNLPEAELLSLRQEDGIIVEPARADFTTLLSNASLSISQAGYNTVIDILRYADRAVLVPFSSDRETEQGDRARLLAERGAVAVVPAEQLSGERLAEAIANALDGPSIRSFAPCDVSGAEATVRLLRQKLS
ncbi:glycosyltransferase family protein [Enhydrobacter aerosaccus]|uniref:glycosyltransferase family protein n=1 Tax=Enhydrobacter aerosaccus TaxID=225324 RepID=UPI001483CD63|nr:glycosyltransferase [Enhydrobacter aerosaccus]